MNRPVDSPQTPYKMTPMKHSQQLSVNSKQLQHYAIRQELGKGSFGTVYKAIYEPTGIPVALKQMSKQMIERDGLQSKIEGQISFMQRFNHPYVIMLFEVIETDKDLYLVQEYAENGDLYEYINRRERIDIAECRKLFQQIVAAVDYLHREINISHRDIKPENILLTENKNVRLTDFELSNRLTEGEFLKTACGSPNYAAPEIISGKPYEGVQCDIWSMGVTLYYLLSGQLPFEDSYTPSLFRKIREGEYEMAPAIADPHARQLIQQMLQVEIEQRITIKEMLNNKFFRDDLDPAIQRQIETQFENEYLNIDPELLQQVNSCFAEEITAPEMVWLIEANKLQSQRVIAYRILYSHKYEREHVRQQKKRPPGYFDNAVYDQYAVPTTNDAPKLYYFGVKLCKVSSIMPRELMLTLFQLLREHNFSWFLGTASRGQFQGRGKHSSTEGVRFSTRDRQPFSFCIRERGQKPMFELIIQCTIYVTKNQYGEPTYILDLKRVVGETGLFLWKSSQINSFLSTIFT